MKPAISHRTAGFTLVEVMVVLVLAGVVTLGLVGFYLNSQATWIDGSSQALAQRDATTILESIADRADSAASVTLTLVPPDTVIEFRGVGGTAYYGFRWRRGAGDDSLVHQGPGSCSPDLGPVVPSIVERFSVALDPQYPQVPVLHVISLRVRSSSGQVVEMKSSFALRNAP